MKEQQIKTRHCPILDKECLLDDCAIYNIQGRLCAIVSISYTLWNIYKNLSETEDA